ncbi:MAG TPA: NAD(P)/FAD-dependent oxidoreductase [Terriglobales bacterium]|nr:NAD(P)/FAD-dependent oxidoreductase [Terriglobales bacterium]
MYDLIVIGGGPAGTSAAITCARNGARVLLLERGRFPRHKVCGEFVSAESLDLLADLLAPQHARLFPEAIRIPRARVFLDGRTLHAPVDPPAASISRLDLDQALWDSAEHCGAESRQQIVVHSISGTGPFLVKTSVGEFESRALVNASGRWSNLNPAPADAQDSDVKWLGLKGHFAEPSPPVSVDLYFFDGGYCGVQPVNIRDGVAQSVRVNACAMVRADVASALAEVFVCHPALQERSRRWDRLSDPVSTWPLVFREPQPERDGMLMAGDAAAFVDPFVGDGISLALRSGSLAGECLIPFFAGSISLAEAAGDYRRTYERRLAPVFRTSSKIRRMLSLPQTIRTPILSLLEKTPAIRRYVVRKTR